MRKEKNEASSDEGKTSNAAARALRMFPLLTKSQTLQLTTAFSRPITVNHGKSRWIKGGGGRIALVSAVASVEEERTPWPMALEFLQFFAVFCDHFFCAGPWRRRIGLSTTSHQLSTRFWSSLDLFGDNWNEFYFMLMCVKLIVESQKLCF